MKCNPLSWLWGLLPLALLAWVAWLYEGPRVEHDLQTRAKEALSAKGLAWAKPEFNGRDGRLTGRAGDEGEQRQAITAVSNVWGVNSIEDRTDVVELVKKYVWSAEMRDNAVRLSGYVPSENERKEIIGTAKAAFPGHAIDDQMKLGRGAPKGWPGRVTFAMKQLAHLKRGGHAEIEDDALSIAGEATSPSVFGTIEAALAGQLPDGLKLHKSNVMAPLVKPYTWGARLKGQQVELTGHVPSESIRAHLLAEARKAMPRATVSDGMTVGSGEPAEWQKVATTVLAKLGQLIEGRAEVRDTHVSLNGLTEREATAEEVRGTFKAAIPAAYKVEEQIRQDPRFKAQEEAAIAARKAAEEDERRKAAAEAARQLTTEELAKRDAAAEAARRAAADAAAQRLANEAEARRIAEQQQAQAAEEARRKAAMEAAARAAADAAAKQRAAALETERLAREAKSRQVEVANRCQTELRSVASSGVINFRTASATIDESSFSTLGKLAEIAKACPEVTIEIAGHTDSEGDAERNQRLSDRRAQSVAEYLTKTGVPVSRLSPVGRGDSQPIASNDTPDGRATNRRIEFSVRSN